MCTHKLGYIHRACGAFQKTRQSVFMTCLWVIRQVGGPHRKRPRHARRPKQHERHVPGPQPPSLRSWKPRVLHRVDEGKALTVFRNGHLCTQPHRAATTGMVTLTMETQPCASLSLTDGEELCKQRALAWGVASSVPGTLVTDSEHDDKVWSMTRSMLTSRCGLKLGCRLLSCSSLKSSSPTS